MKIDSSGSPGSPIQSAKEGGKSQPSQTVNNNLQQQNTNTGASDMVSLSDAAARMQRLEQLIAAQPVVNSQRVEQMQQVVNDGNLKTDPAQLAAKVFNFESALNSARTRD